MYILCIHIHTCIIKLKQYYKHFFKPCFKQHLKR